MGGEEDRLLVSQRIPRGFNIALGLTALVWSVAASALATRSAHGLTQRFGLGSGEPLLASIFLIFLVVLGFQLLDWVATCQSRPAETFPLPRRSGWPGEWGLGAAIGWGASLATVVPLLLSGNLHGHLGLGIHHPVDLLMLLLALLAGTLAEELIFRGYVFARLSAALGQSWAVVCTSLLFGAVAVWAHGPENLVLALLSSTVLGVLLACAFLRTHALWLAWGLHFAYRAVMLLLIGLPAAGRANYSSVMDSFATGPLWLTGGGFGLDAALLTLPILLVALAILYRTTRDYAWNYTFRPIVGAGDEVVVPPPKAHAAIEERAVPAPLVQILSTTSQSPTVPPPPKPLDS